MAAPQHLDQNLLQKLLLGQLPPADVERLAREFADDNRLAELADSLVGSGDTLMDLLQNHETVADPEGERLVERLLRRLQPDLASSSVEAAPVMHLTDGHVVDMEAATEGCLPGDAPTTQTFPTELEHYRPLKVLGQGGMGTVYLAEDTRLGREVAIKTLRPELAVNAAARERFLREARAAAKLEHDHIISIYSVGEANGTPFLAMPFLKGEPLDALIKRTGGPLPVNLAVRLAREVASGLAVAHERGLIHRDIKPGNIWLEAPNGRVKILDFGLAKAADAGTDTELQPTLTASGAIVGTPAYMAPEQASGHAVDARADLFSLGCMLYEMLAGKRPFSGPNTLSILMSLAVQNPPPPDELSPQCPAALSRLVMQLLEKNPDKRLASAQAVIAALDELHPSGAGTIPVAAVVSRPSTATQFLSAFDAPAAPSTRTSMKRPDSVRNRLAVITAICLLATCGVAYLFGGQIVRIITNKGELVIETADGVDNIEVRILQNGGVVHDKTSDRTFELKAGDGQIEVWEKDGIYLKTKEFSLIRNGRQTVKVTLDELTAARNQIQKTRLAAKAADQPKPSVGPDPIPSALPLADKENPFVLVHARGKSQEEFSSWSSVLGALSDGDVIEVHGNGPFTLGAVSLRKKGLRLRAAAGYRPQFVLSKNVSAYYWFDIDEAVVDIEGCDFRCGNGLGYLCFQGNGPVWEFRNCRFMGAKVGFIGYRGPKLRFVDCLISGFSPNGYEGIGAGANTSRLEMENTIYWTHGYQMLQVPGEDHSTADWQVNLQRNTLLVNGSLLLHLERKKYGKTRVEASQNLLQVTGVANNQALKTIGGWVGRENLYVGREVLWTVPNGAKERVRGLAAWAEFWGADEQGGQEAEWAHFTWDEVRRKGQEPQGVIKALSPVTAALTKQYGASFQDLGPDWTIVGPGDPYVRALAAAGKPVAKADLRPEPLSDGPFVLIQGEKIVRGYANIGDAVAAAEDGAIIEIRTDEPLGTCPLKGDKPRQLTVRAAPGYRPTAEGGFDFASKNLSLAIEGLHFRMVPLGVGLNGSSTTLAVQNRITRLANCSFTSDSDFAQFAGRIHRNGINGPRLEGADGQPGEIINCLIPGIVSTTLLKDGKLRIQNSVVGVVQISASTPGSRVLELERSIVWNPCSDQSAIEIGVTDPQKVKADLAVVARHTLFEPGSKFIVSHDGISLSNWTGAGNVYRVGHRQWLAESDKPGAIGLADWRLRWKSDADSVEADPVDYDPQQWRLLPSSPGYQAGPDGVDLGADTSRIATVNRGGVIEPQKSSENATAM